MYRKSILRILLLALLVAAGIILVFCRDINIDSFTMFCIAILITKAVGITLIALSWTLYNHWCPTDPLLSRYERWCRQAEEAEL